MQTVICSHGFGVRADSRGMFPDIASSLPEYNFVMFDYNEVLPNGDVLVASLDEQAKKLQVVINEQPGGSTLLCHSQGCIIAGLVDLTRISKVILLAPPTTMSMQRVIDKLMNRPGSEINLNGISKLPRSDGTTTLIPAAYVKSLEGRDPFEIYKDIAKTKPTLIVRATEDEVIGLTNVDEVHPASHLDINSDHDFTGDSRAKLITALKTTCNQRPDRSKFTAKTRGTPLTRPAIFCTSRLRGMP